MNQVLIRRGNLELSRLSLAQPVSTVGRSPVCDGILRAPGVKPVHFLLEWQGAGDFRGGAAAGEGAWVVFDVSSPGKDEGEASEGRVLGSGEVQFRGFTFKIHADSFAPAEKIGGAIRESLVEPRTESGAVLEIVRIRRDSGAVEQVLHLDSRRRWRAFRPFRDFPQFRISLEPNSGKSSLSIDTRDVELFRGNQRLAHEGAIELGAGALIRIDWKDWSFFLRWTERPPHVPVAPRDFFGSRLLRDLSLGGLVVTLILAGTAIRLANRSEPVMEVAPPRVATVEIQEAPPPPPQMQDAPASVSPRTQDVQASSNARAAAAQAVAPSRSTRQNPGLNSTKAPTDVNRVGLLGSLRKSGPSGPGIRAEQVFNRAAVTDPVSSKTSGSVLLKNPPSGTLGSGSSGDVRGGKQTDLAAASTTLAGGKNFDPKSAGPIAAAGRNTGYTVGSGLGKLGVGGSGGNAGRIGSISEGSLDVQGGLDRETVRRIVMSRRGQIQICYERALLGKPRITGRIVTRFEITPSGLVNTAKVQKSEVGSPALEACVIELLRGLTFPESFGGGGTTVFYPFQFQAKEN